MPRRKSEPKFEKCPYCGSTNTEPSWAAEGYLQCNECGGEYPTPYWVDRVNVRKMRYTPNKGKFGECTLIPMIYTVWGREVLIFVDKKYAHPDPNGLLTWGRDTNGDVVPGDFNGRFRRVGKTITFTYSLEGTRTANEETTRRIDAIKERISEYMNNVVQVRRTKPVQATRSIKRKKVNKK